jgi:hypothetical protein
VGSLTPDIIELNKEEWVALRSKFSTSKKGGKVKLLKLLPSRGF